MSHLLYYHDAIKKTNKFMREIHQGEDFVVKNKNMSILPKNSNKSTFRRIYIYIYMSTKK